MPLKLQNATFLFIHQGSKYLADVVAVVSRYKQLH